MNARAATAIAIAAALVVGLAWWALRPTEAAGPDADVELGDKGSDEATGAPPPKVLRERPDADGPPEEPDKDLALPDRLPRLPVKLPGRDYGKLTTGGQLSDDQGAAVVSKAYLPAIACLAKVRQKHPDARGRLTARLHIAPGADGRAAVQNLELIGKEGAHPALVACLDRDLRTIAVDLPDGARGIVTAPLVLGPPPGDFDPEEDETPDEVKSATRTDDGAAGVAPPSP